MENNNQMEKDNQFISTSSVHRPDYNEGNALQNLLTAANDVLANSHIGYDQTSDDNYLEDSFSINIGGKSVAFLLGGPQLMALYDFVEHISIENCHEFHEVDDDEDNKLSLSLSSAECNCLIEAIEEANSQVLKGGIVYVKDGYQTDSIEEQSAYANVTNDIATVLERIIEQEQPTIIHFEP